MVDNQDRVCYTLGASNRKGAFHYESARYDPQYGPRRPVCRPDRCLQPAGYPYAVGRADQSGTVPITLQFLFTALAGLLLGWKWGAVSQLLYVGIGLLGLPVFTQGGGIGYVLQPSFGFLLGLIPAAAVIGALTARRTGYLNILAAVLVGDLILYAVGVPYMYLILHVYMQSAKTFPALLAAMLVYVPGDTLKIVVVTALVPVLRRTLAKAVPNL